MKSPLASLLRRTERYPNVIWIAPANPSSQRLFEGLACRRKQALPWGPGKPVGVPLSPRVEGKALFLWNPVVHLPEPGELARSVSAMVPGDRLALLLSQPSLTADRWLHEAADAGLEPMKTVALGSSPFLPGAKLHWHSFRHSIPWRRSPSLSVVIPSENEAGNLLQLLPRLSTLAGIEVEFLFVEGNSRDDTWGAIERLRLPAPAPWRKVALRQPGRGRADAIHCGFENAGGELVVALDAGLTVPPEAVRRAYESFRDGKGELIYGDRFLVPMEPGAMPIVNRLANRFFARALTAVVGQPIGDAFGGLKLLSREDYREILRWRLKGRVADPFADFDLLLGAAALGLRLHPQPVSYKPRVYGASAVRWRDGLRLLGSLFPAFLLREEV